MIYPNVAKLSDEEIKLLCEEYRENNYIDPQISEHCP